MRIAPIVAIALFATLGVAGCNKSQLTAAAAQQDDPVAIITGSQSYGVLDTAAFDGSTSYDPGGSAITGYAWAIVSAPSGSQAQPVASGAQANFFCDLAGDYSIRLTVTDALGKSGSTTWAFSAVPSQDLHVELLWPGQYGQVDMDLHLVNKGAGGKLWNGLLDCNYSDCAGGASLDWGTAGYALDNPTLDIDNITSNTPENINIKKPADGTYAACVHYFASHTTSGNDIPTNNEVRIYLLGVQAADLTQAMTATDQTWYVADITCSSGQCTVTPNGTLGTTLPGLGLSTCS